MAAERRKRGARGSVSTFQTSRGLWRARFSYVDPETGEKRRADITRKHQSDLRDAIKEFQTRIEHGMPLRDSAQTLRDWISEWETHRLRDSDRKATTQELHRSLARNHIAPSPLGGMSLSEIKTLHLTRFMGSLQEKSLSESTRRNIYAVVKAIFQDAVSDGLISKSPMTGVKRPRMTRREARFLTTQEVMRVLDDLKESRYLSPITLAAMTGMRRGEVLGLYWEDIDLEAATVRVRATVSRVQGKILRTEPKTENSRRSIPLSPSAVGLLRQRRLAQTQERLRAGERWEGSDYVFTTESGAPMDGRNMLRAFQNACNRIGLEGVGIHSLRHFAATSLLDSKVPVLVVSRLLGHSSMAITADVYGHVIDDTARGAMDHLAASLAAG